MKKFLSILLAVMMVLSTVSFAAPSIAGVADTAVETPVAEAPVAEEAEETAELAADISEDTSTYGELIFELNFDNLAIQSNSGETSFKFADAGYINSDAEQYSNLSENANIYTKEYTTVAIKERSAGNNYYEVTGGTAPYAVVLLQSGSNGFQTKNGVYTLTADVYRPDNMPLTTRFSGGSSEDTPIEDYTGLVSGGWGKMILQHDPTCFGNGGHETPFTSIAEAKDIKFHRAGGDAQTVGYDNIKLYYKPLTVNVTVNWGDKTETVPVSTTEATSIASLADAFDLGVLYSVTGAKIGDKTYATTDSVVFAKDTTVEIQIEKIDDKYVSAEHGLMVFDIDFENEAVGTYANGGNIKLTNYVTPIGSKVLSHEASNWHINFSVNDVVSVMADPTDANNKVLGAINYTDGGYPAVLIDTWADTAAARYGFIEDDNLIWTIEYNYYDTTNDGATLRFGGRSSVAENEGKAKWTEVEDVPAETFTGKVANTWYTITGVQTAEKYSRMGGSDEISFVKLHSASPANANLYWDNVRLYYRPATVDVTIADCTIPGVTVATSTVEDASTSMTVSALLTAAGVDYSAVSNLSYVFKGVSLDAEGTEVYGLNDTLSLLEDSTVYLIFDEVDMSEWTDENGILVMEMDFENLSSGSVAQRSLISDIGRVNPYFANSEVWAIDLSGLSQPASIVTDATTGSKVLKTTYTTTGARSWPQFLFGYLDNDKGLNTVIRNNGTFYVVGDVKAEFVNAANFTGVNLATNGYKDGTHQGPGNIMNFGTALSVSENTLATNTWYTVGGTNNVKTAGIDGPTKFTFVLEHGANTAGTVTTVYLDNIKVCWKPDTVNVTINGGRNADFETVTLENVSTTATIDDILAMIPGSTTEYGKITGLADANGNKLTEFGAITDVTYQALWSPWVIVNGGQEFPVDEKGINGTQYTGTYGDKNEVGDGGSDITTAVRALYSGGWYTSDGNFFKKMITPKMGEEENGKLTSPTPYSVPAAHSVDANGNIRTSVYTTLAANNDAEYVLIKYQYHNLPDLAAVVAADTNPAEYKYTLSENGEELTYYDRTGAKRVFEMAPDYGMAYYIKCQDNSYQHAGGTKFHEDELMVEGEWYYDFLPFTADMNTKGVKEVLFQPYNMFDGEIIEYDYVRFVKIGEEEEAVKPVGPGPVVDAPKSLENATTYRYSEKDMEKYGEERNGIRFLASVTSEARDEATEIGYVIALESAVSNYEDVKVDADFDVVVGYLKQDNAMKASFFDSSDDEALQFAVVLYGIPERNAETYVIARPFVKVGDTYVYGTAFSTNLYKQVAKLYFEDPADPEGSNILDSFYDLPEEQQIYIEDIIYAVNEW